MGWNAGTFSLTTAGLPYVTGTTISSTVANNLNTELQTGINQTVNKDGSNAWTGNLNAGGFKVLNLGAATLVSDAARASQVQNGALNILTGVTGVTTIAGAAAITPAAYAEGQKFSFVAVGANAAGPSLNVSGLGAVPIYWNATTATASQFRSGMAVEVIYLAGAVSTASQTGFHVTGYTGFIPASLISTKGDLLVGGASNSVIVLPAGSDEQVLVATASASAGIGWRSLSGLLPSSSTTVAGVIEMAVQAEMEAENSGFAVTPDVMRFHPGICKAWVVADFAGGITVGYNITSVTDGGGGIATVAWGNDFSTGNYTTLGQAFGDTTTPYVVTRNVAGGVSSADANFRCFEASGGTLADATNWSIAAFGDQ